MPFLLRVFIFVLSFLLCYNGNSYGKVAVTKYGLSENEANPSAQQVVRSVDSFLNDRLQLVNADNLVRPERIRPMNDKTVDFYFLLLLCIILGLIRLIDPRYLHNLWSAFRNPVLSARQLKDQLEGASLSSLLMNVFFTLVSGAYIYHLVVLFMPATSRAIPSYLLLSMIIGGMMLIYLVKYFVIRFSGWAFRVEGITEHYIFNVFLINKVIAITLLPVTLLLAFADPNVSGPIAIISFIVIGFLLTNRYTRSWQIFGSFFQYSKFHFFTYLCASELLPLAVLMKLLVKGLA